MIKISQYEILEIMLDGRWYTIKLLARILGKNTGSVGMNMKRIRKWHKVETKQKMTGVQKNRQCYYKLANPEQIKQCICKS